jgi:hypothetical protein
MKELLLGALFVSLATIGSNAYASDSVVVNGVTYHCDNSCVVTTSNGVTTVRDCCGGRVGARFPPKEQ